jgi:hypothetical protein
VKEGTSLGERCNTIIEAKGGKIAEGPETGFSHFKADYMLLQSFYWCHHSNIDIVVFKPPPEHGVYMHEGVLCQGVKVLSCPTTDEYLNF